MPSIRLIKRRIRSVQNTAKITNAISMVAASKMRRAQLRGLQGRPYAEQISTVISHLAALPNAGEEPQPLLDKRPVKRIAYIHITADRGLCGPLNSNMNRAGFQFIQSQSAPVGVVAVGRRGREFMARGRGDVKAVFTDLGDAPGLLDTVTISNGEIKVYLGYTLFVWCSDPLSSGCCPWNLKRRPRRTASRSGLYLRAESPRSAGGIAASLRLHQGRDRRGLSGLQPLR